MDRKNVFLCTSVGIASVLSFGLYYYFTKPKKTVVSTWLEEYIKEVDSKLATGDRHNPSVDTILSILTLCSEVEDYLYQHEHQELEEERLESINRKEVYEHLVFETEKRKDKCATEAVEFVQKRLGVSFDRLNEILKNVERSAIVFDIESYRKAYTCLPVITRDRLREAYKTYSQMVITNNMVKRQQLAIVERNQEYESIALKIIHINRSLTEDTIQKNYGVRTKFLSQLLHEHKLLEDPEIKNLYENVKELK
jgi:hypothetical protein